MKLGCRSRSWSRGKKSSTPQPWSEPFTVVVSSAGLWSRSKRVEFAETFNYGVGVEVGVGISKKIGVGAGVVVGISEKLGVGVEVGVGIFQILVVGVGVGVAEKNLQLRSPG